jgi:hypothetical protein
VQSVGRACVRKFDRKIPSDERVFPSVLFSPWA